MAAGSSFLQQLKDTLAAIGGAAHEQYAAGPQSAPLTPGTGSVLDQKNGQVQRLFPAVSPLTAPGSSAPSSADLINPAAAYGDRPGEKVIDVTEYTKPLSGMSGVKRKVQE
jgi:hypothetical protein